MLTQPSLFQHHNVELKTSGCCEFLDFTEDLEKILERSGIQMGIMNIQSKHTTAAVLINENEPLLLNDMKRILERIAPQQEIYLHNDLTIRTVNLQENEDRNGHSHCKALFLPTSQMINIVNGKLDLGRWQRVFLLELDQPKKRNISVIILGL